MHQKHLISTKYLEQSKNFQERNQKMATIERLLFILVCCFCHFGWLVASSTYPDTIVQGQTFTDWDHLDSPNGYFRLQFFSPEGTSKNRYLGILLIKYGLPNIYDMVMWVANRDIPIADASGRLVVDSTGNLTVANSGGDVFVLYNAQEAKNVSATLLDSGNFVLRKINTDGSTGKVLWQSFDYPTDVLLPGMKLGVDYRTGHVSSLVSWASMEAPARGSFTLGVDVNSTSDQLVIWWREKIFWTSGPWLNGSFENAATLSYEPDVSITYTYISNQNEKYFVFSASKNGIFPRYRMAPYGGVLQGESMASFATCAGYQDLNNTGCIEEELPQCRSNDEWFVDRRGDMSDVGLKFPNFTEYDCQQECHKNCSCVAYASISDNGTGCELWSQRRGFFSYDGSSSRTIYMLHKEKAKWWIKLVVPLAAVLLLSSCFTFCYLARRKLKGRAAKEQKMFLSEIGANNSIRKRKKKLANDANRSQDLQIFDFGNILTSTNNFAGENKLGEGGFGPVYKGILNGQEVAIKRLSRNSDQGVVEFKNELALVAKLQHNNLVRLIGCCIKKEEKMLVYEYMPNKSLDFFLFDPTKKSNLGWKTRFNIMEGVAQGLGYLHVHSRLKIIHRDLKASNILLDGAMNPKISDFGMARIFGRNESEANTKRIVGTFGYMSPEYTMEGIFSMKSDIFSFGVLLLEIVSGKKNRSCYHPDRPLNLIGYAWELWREGRGLELIDSIMDSDSYQSTEVLRCIHVGLLCVQENPIDRPTILDVVSMLGNENVPLSMAKTPAFFIGLSSQGEIIHRSTLENCSLNGVSISKMEPR